MLKRSLLALSAVALLPFLPVPASAQSSATPLTSRTFIDVSHKVLPGVVSINVIVPPRRSVYDDDAREEMLRQFLREGAPDGFFQERFGLRGSGSGVVVGQSADGKLAYILTNRHVLEDSPRTIYTIRLDSSFDRSTSFIDNESIRVLGVDELTDIAVLEAELPEGVSAPIVEFADSDMVEVGEWVMALGNPLDFANSVSQGIIAAKDRELGMNNRLENLLQTTAVINPGNSGGPLVNLDGEIIGINNSIATGKASGNWAGIGFAIPSNDAQRVAEIIIRDGKVSRGYLGIEMQDVDHPYSLASDREVESGVSIQNVIPGTPAAEAGLELGDVVVEVDGKRVEDSKMLLAAIANRFAGDRIDVTYLRFENEDPTEYVTTVQLAERPLRGGTFTNLQNPPEWDTIIRPLIDGQLEAVREDGFRALKVVELDRRGDGADAGLQEGDLIISANGSLVTSGITLQQALESAEEGADHVLRIRRDGELETIILPSQ